MRDLSAMRALAERVYAVAARQHGVVTRRQLLAAGLTPAGIRHRLASGQLRALHRGVYLVGPLEPPHARFMAAVLASGPRVLLSHGASATLWLPVTSVSGPDPLRGGVDDRAIDVTATHAGRGRRSGIRLHRVRELSPADGTVRDGIPVTTPIRTVLDLAPLLDTARLEQLTARFAREGVLDLDELAKRVAAQRGRRGMPALRAVLEKNGGPAFTRSQAEALFLSLVREAKLPGPRVNAGIGRYELDFFWPDERLAVEVDGFRHHSSRPRFEGDRRKDAWLRARGISVIRLSWRQITQEATATAVQVGQALMHTLR